MHISIYQLHDKEVIEIDGEENLTILDIKNQIMFSINILPHFQTLFCKGLPLPNSLSIKTLPITKGASKISLYCKKDFWKI